VVARPANVIFRSPDAELMQVADLHDFWLDIRVGVIGHISDAFRFNIKNLFIYRRARIAVVFALGPL